MKYANDNFRTRRIADPFHRLFADGALDADIARNHALHATGERYRIDFDKTGRSTIASPDYAKPQVSCGRYDPYRDLSSGERILDKHRPFYSARNALQALGLAQLVDDILLHNRPVEVAGKAYSSRNQPQQARAAAITALVIALRVLERHYASAQARAA